MGVAPTMPPALALDLRCGFRFICRRGISAGKPSAYSIAIVYKLRALALTLRMEWNRFIDVAMLRGSVRKAVPFPCFCIDGFLDEAFARAVAESYPAYAQALAMGHSYHAVNEKQKVQVSDAALFPEPVAQLHALLSAPEFCAQLGEVFGIDGLVADPLLDGGGMHLSASGGHLDVHVDFNYIADRGLHRRLNILLYLNEVWDDAWGGSLELWDADVKTCVQRFAPVFNRCVVFETSDISFHGVTAIRCPAGVFRHSFAAYYYTREAPAHWRGQAHSTIFKARPHERFKGYVLMPLEKLARRLKRFMGLG